MLIKQTDYLWKRNPLEDINIVADSFIYVPEKPVRVYKFDSADYTGEITIFETEDATEPLYQGTLPYIPDMPIAFDGLVFVLPEREDPISVTIHLVAEVGTPKAVLTPYLNTTTGMSAISSSYNDDSVYNTAGLSSFKFNGTTASTIYISSNHYIGFGSNSEQLKICRRDGCSTAIYRQSISLADGIQVLKIRFEGYTVYNNRVPSNRLVFEVFLISNNDIFLNIVTTPTSGNYGESSLVCNGITTPLNVNVGSPDGAMISFYHKDAQGKTWDIAYEAYTQSGVSSRLYLLRLEDMFYTVADGEMVALDVTEPSALAFLEHGFEELPNADFLTPLVNPQLYLWESGEDTTPVKAVLKAYPYPQTLSCVADMSHITILSIKLFTAEYSGDVRVQYSIDDSVSYTEEIAIAEFLNTDLNVLWKSLPESKRLYLCFILHDDATLSRFKITYENSGGM
ncbi:hypothetical protein [uncultured Allofournierella sp.]|uniref:hypothetical protein n=1 Tax=uncultured Allofournierella sp. TaxID=1940258 RepID=UPI0037530795